MLSGEGDASGPTNVSSVAATSSVAVAAVAAEPPSPAGAEKPSEPESARAVKGAESRVLMPGAAVAAAAAEGSGAAAPTQAVAFGAQRLIADIFHRFVMLLENQYKVNDVVRVAGTAGLVERITLRISVLRDLEGVVHFIPNSEIKTVSNMTHGWSRALFEVGVAYKEDADRVMEILTLLGKELRKDAKFGRRRTRSA